MKKSGFSLIELLIAMAVGSIIMFAVYRTFDQTKKSAQRLDAILQKDNMIAPLYNQLEKDCTAIYVPLSAYPPKKEQQPAQQPPVKPAPAKPEEAPKLLEKIFYSTSKSSLLQELSFITTTSLLGYNETSPHLVRVTYAVKPEVENLYTLMRSESTQLAYKPEKESTVKSYEIVNNIKNISVKYYARPVSEKEEESEYKVFKEWSSEEQFKKIKRRIPDYIEFTIVWWDQALQKEYDFVIELPIIAQEKEEEKKAEKAQAPQPPPAGAKPPTTPPATPANKPGATNANPVLPLQQTGKLPS